MLVVLALFLSTHSVERLGFGGKSHANRRSSVKVVEKNNMLNIQGEWKIRVQQLCISPPTPHVLERKKMKIVWDCSCVSGVGFYHSNLFCNCWLWWWSWKMMKNEHCHGVWVVLSLEKFQAWIHPACFWGMMMMKGHSKEKQMHYVVGG